MGNLMGWMAFFVGVAGVVSLVGLYRPDVFVSVKTNGGPDLVAWFTNPPALLRSAAWSGVFVFVAMDVSFLLALGVFALWVHHFPMHCDAVLGMWSQKFGVSPEQLPWSAQALVTRLNGRLLDLVPYPLVFDLAATFTIVLGVTSIVGSFEWGIILVAVTAAAWLWAKSSGRDKVVLQAIGAI